MYGKLSNGELIEAPELYVTTEGNEIPNFNRSITLMKDYGFKPVIDTKPGYDVDTEYCKHVGFVDNGRYIRYSYEVEPIEPTKEARMIEQTDLALGMLKINLSSILTHLSDEKALLVPMLFPEWEVGKEYAVGDRVLYLDTLYKVLTAHTSQKTWEPDVAPSLFAKVLIVKDDNGEQVDIPEWVQPESTNPYMTGDKVKFKGAVYESVIDNNVWSPTDYPSGWKTVE